jgi:hypothetical protein
MTRNELVLLGIFAGAGAIAGVSWALALVHAAGGS